MLQEEEIGLLHFCLPLGNMARAGEIIREVGVERSTLRGGGGVAGSEFYPGAKEKRNFFLPSLMTVSVKKNSHTHNIECVYIRGEGKKGWDFTNFFWETKGKKLPGGERKQEKK